MDRNVDKCVHKLRSVHKREPKSQPKIPVLKIQGFLVGIFGRDTLLRDILWILCGCVYVCGGCEEKLK